MDQGLGAGGVEECKSFSPPSVSKTNAASPRVPLGSVAFNTPTPTPMFVYRRPTIGGGSDKVGGYGKKGQIRSEDRRTAPP